MAAKRQIKIPYGDILGTPEQELLQESLDQIAPGFRLYDERVFITPQFAEKLKEITGEPEANHATLIRKIIREDKVHLFPEIPEAWFWIHFVRLLYNFNMEPDPWFEVKWWVWLEQRGTRSAVNLAGCQNCLGKDIPVLMADGTRKMSQDIQLGDMLMGPDSTPRRVLKLHQGKAPLYRVTPKMGDSWVCTGNHKLELECTRPRRNGSGSPSQKHYVGARQKVTAEEWLDWSAAMKTSYKQVHASTELPEKELEIDPYIFGLWLGDGCAERPTITNPDKPILEAWEKYFTEKGFKCRTQDIPDNEAVSLHVSGGPLVRSRNTGRVNVSWLKEFFRSTLVDGEKRIPEDYLTGSLEQRRKLLAGFIDADGHYPKNSRSIEISQSRKGIAYDLKRLAENLGFLVSIRKRKTNYTLKSGKIANAYRLYISGDFRPIPILLERKKPVFSDGPNTRKSGLTGFDIEPIGEDDFYGWTVDEDNMFLLGNGCITNNSGKSHWLTVFTITQLVVWEHMCKAYLSGPYKSHTDDKLWGELETQLSILRHRGISLKAAFGIEINQRKNDVIVQTDKGQGLIKFIASQEAASVVGSKTKDHADTTGRIGISLFIIDEYVENVNTDMERGFGNFRSNYNSCLFLACNPDPARSLNPNVIAFIDPIDKRRTAMKKATDYRWRTRKGIVVRLDWNNCPNRILGKNRWTYLMNEQRASSQQHESEHIREAQLYAWPFGADIANTLTDAQRQITAGVFSDYHRESPIQQRFLCMDPSFGGRDPSVYTILETASVNTGADQRQRFIGVEQRVLPGIESDYIADAEFVRKCQRIAQYRRDQGDNEVRYLLEIHEGQAVGPMAQGAVLAAELCIDKNIPFKNFTFDSSQRLGCGDWMFKVFGRHNIIWYYEGSTNLLQEQGDDWHRWPYKTRDDKRDGSRYEKWSDWCGRTTTMIWAFACELINNGFLIDGEAVQNGLNELGAREIAPTASGKVDIWSKADIKRGTFQGKKIPKMDSPAWAETLAMGMYFATRFHNAVNLGERPELSSHFGSSLQDDDDEYLELTANW